MEPMRQGDLLMWPSTLCVYLLVEVKRRDCPSTQWTVLGKDRFLHSENRVHCLALNEKFLIEQILLCSAE